MRVLLVDDQPAAARVLSLTLQTECSAIIDVVHTGEEAFSVARHYDYDAIVLDVMLPDMQGFQVLRRLRNAGQNAPVLALSGAADAEVRVRALQAGADDVMSRPFDNNELCARLKAIVRRSRGHSQPSLQIGELHLDLETREVRVGDQQVHLTPKEHAILHLLALRRGTVITKEQFLSHLYGGVEEPEIKIIDVFVCKLRRKLAVAGADNLVGTIWGRGYVLQTPSASMPREQSPTFTEEAAAMA